MSTALLAGLVCSGLPGAARAEEVEVPKPPEVRGLRIVIPAAQGKASFGGDKLTKSLRSALSEAVGELVPPKSFQDAQKKLGLKGRAAQTPENLAKAGKAAGAQFVLQVEITKKGWVYTANAQMVNVDTAELQMDFKSGYYKPPEEAADRGRRIARAAVGKLVVIVQEGRVPGGAVAAAPPAGSGLNERVDDSPPPPPPPPRKSSALDERLDDPPPSAPPPKKQTASAPPPPRDPEPETEPEPAASAPASGSGSAPASSTAGEPPPAASDPPPSGGSSSAGQSTAEVSPSAPRDNSTEIMRATVTAGSGLLHTYDVSSSAVATSELSYRLSPMALYSGDVEARIPSIGVGAFFRAAYSPVKFKVEVAQKSVAEPSGSLLDLGFGVNLHLAISGSGRSAYEIVPAAGLRLISMSVDNHPANIILSSSSVTPFVGVGLRMPLTEMLDLTLGFDGGYVVAYSEEPDQTGTSASGGFQLGGGLGVRLWLSDFLGLGLDTRFDLQNVGLEGTPSRQRPSQEDLTDASIGTRDLRTSLGIAFRI